jgi:hypothetical protein
MRLRLLVCTLVLTAASAFAADIDGKWSGSMDTPNGAINLFYNLKAEGSTVTGTMTGPDGSEVKIDNGKLDGDKVTFTATVDFNGMQVTIGFSGLVKGNDIALTMDFMGMPFPIALKKAA